MENGKKIPPQSTTLTTVPQANATENAKKQIKTFMMMIMMMMMMCVIRLKKTKTRGPASFEDE